MSHRPARQSGDAHLLGGVRRRLVLWSAGSTLVLLVLLGSALYLSVDSSLAAAGRSQLDLRATSIRHYLEQLSPGGLSDPDGDAGEAGIGRAAFGGPGSGTIAIILDPDGAFVGPRPIDATGLPVLSAVAAALTGVTDVRTATVHEAPVRVWSEKVMIDGEQRVLQVVQDRTAEQRTLNTLVATLLGGGLAVLAVAALFGFIYAGRALVPIRESLRRQREFAADASHELRTPLAIVRGSVEHLQRHAGQRVSEVGEALTDIQVEVDRLTHLVDDLLLLARSDSGAIELQRVSVHLADAAGDAVSRLRAQADGLGVELRLDAAPASVSGDPERIRQLVAILVDNAIRHSPADRVVMVTVRGDGHPTIAVEDEGAGIRNEDLPHVFDRFWRAADAPEGGTGLGLAIAAWIARHHGAAISVVNRPEGGARFQVQFPRS